MDEVTPIDVQTAVSPEAIDEVLAANDLQIGEIGDFINNGKYPGDADLPDGIKGERRGRKPVKKIKETTEAIADTIAMVNGMFAMAVPCSCADTLPAELRGIAHRDTCVTTWPLNEQEHQALSAAIKAEIESHPEWISKLEHADEWVAHLMLATTIFGIVMARRLRAGAILMPADAPLELQNVATNFSQNGLG